MFKKSRVSRLITLLMVISLLATCLGGCGQKQVRENELVNTVAEPCTIVDMAGRSHTIPAEVNKVFCTTWVGSIITYTLVPEKLVGWNHEIKPGAKKFILKEYQDLPELGGWYCKGSCNIEEILKIHPDIVLFSGIINSQGETAISQVERLQKQLNIPVIMVNVELAELDQAYEFMGDLFGEQERAQELGEYCRETVAEIKEKEKTIPQDKRVKVYYAEGADGLKTASRGSMHTRVLNMVGGINVAEVVQKDSKGMMPISLEQLLLWNPELIISWGNQRGGYYEGMFTDPKWANIQAVKDKRIYVIPVEPFNWFERPISVNQIIGLKWMGNLLYPEVFNYDMHKETKDFYSKFYHYELTDEEVDDLLKYSTAES